jgi:hypothetical protein
VLLTAVLPDVPSLHTHTPIKDLALGLITSPHYVEMTLNIHKHIKVDFYTSEQKWDKRHS